MTTTTTSIEKTYSTLGNLIKLLPTGTVFLFQFLNPVLTNNGECHPINKYLSAILIGVCGFSCCFACFTDSYEDCKGTTHYGVVTTNGIWPSTNFRCVDLSFYKLRIGDFAHAALSLAIFAVLALLDTNTVRCFYPSFESTAKAVLMTLPAVIGAISGGVSTMFPYERHGIGYPCYTPRQPLRNQGCLM